MLEPIDDLPDGCFGLEAVGMFSTDDSRKPRPRSTKVLVAILPVCCDESRQER